MKNYIYLSFLLVSVVLTSCKKQNQEFLYGEWDLISKPLPDVEYKWYFSESKVYVMATDANENQGITGDLDTCAYGAYVLKNGVLTLALPAVSCRGSVYAGDWDIQGLTETYMTIRRETNSGTQWYEFEKAGE